VFFASLLPISTIIMQFTCTIWVWLQKHAYVLRLRATSGLKAPKLGRLPYPSEPRTTQGTRARAHHMITPITRGIAIFDVQIVGSKLPNKQCYRQSCPEVSPSFTLSDHSSAKIFEPCMKCTGRDSAWVRSGTRPGPTRTITKAGIVP
jgi:hypothetical protein